MQGSISGALPEGLATAEARRRREQFGANAMPDVAAGTWRRVAGKFWAPVPWMLEAAIGLQLVLGEYVEASAIAALLLFNAALGFFQEARAQATLDALKARLALSAVVRRDGRWGSLPVADLVPGDIIKLTLGDVVGADVRLVDGDLLLDHSMLTGESLPVEAGAGGETYAGALVRRGEAVAEVTATGKRTRFGRTAELVRTAHVASSQQKAVLRVVRNLAFFNIAVVVLQAIYAVVLKLPAVEIIPLVLTAVLAAIPVALPATFTLASALAARQLARQGVLLTRLSAVDEAATMDVLCVDKTGTLTRNELAVTAVRPLAGHDVPHVLALAALASADAGKDPVDQAIRRAAAQAPAADVPARIKFVPFDPSRKMSEAMATDSAGGSWRVLKGAFARIGELAQPSAEAAVAAHELEAQGFRVLAVGLGKPAPIEIVGLVALSDPPRQDSAGLIARLRDLGVRSVMITGDSPRTAAVVAEAVGLDAGVCARDTIPPHVHPEEYGVFAGVLPEDKYRIVEAFQSAGHTVGMCGDGANDAPALRQAQMGIAVASATDVAKSAAGMVLTEPGLGGIVAAVQAGRIAFQRILTYVLRAMTTKLDQLLFLTVGLVMSGHAILTPMLMVILMLTGDFLAMSATTDNVQPSGKPNAWRIDNVTLAGIVLALCNLIFCSAALALGKFWLGFGTQRLRTFAAVILVFSAQAMFYAVRERRRLWSSRPSTWLMLSSAADVLIMSSLAIGGLLMAPLPPPVVVATLAAAALFAFVLDGVKSVIFGRLQMG